MILAGLFVLASCLQAETEQFYKFPKDTTWSFKLAAGNVKDALRMKVTGEAEGRTLVTQEMKGPGSKAILMAWYSHGGYLYWGERDGEAVSDAVSLLMIGSKKGDAWKIGEKKGVSAQEGSNLGTEDVTVPAGTYKGALHTRVTTSNKNGKITMDFFLAPKVGVVKMVWTTEATTMSLELEEFRPGK